jgi:predicted ATPase/class 3 adenylate cyclase
MDLGEWLRSLGLERYEPTFRENDIDDAILPGLTAEDLKELGISSLGHRHRLLDAIAALRAGESGTGAPAAAEATLAIPGSRPEERAERRQVTVMFSDLVGSTALSARLDPEDLREVTSAYQTCVAEIVHRFDGFVAAHTGDGVLAYFGYPEAHEDDAERAIRAGLEMVIAVTRIETHATVQTRVGIATGLVIVGDLFETDASQHQAIVGETPNLAARLQSIAAPDCVVVAEGTRKLIGDLFELRFLGTQNLKGIAEPVRAWSAQRASSVESRFDALHASGLTEFVGRREEVEYLLRRWALATGGDGQVVLVSGEAGIGKSRLAIAFSECLGAPHTRMRYFCSPQHTNTPFFPIIGQMERAAEFTQDDSPKTKLDKLDALFARSFTSPHDAALFCEMLSLANDGRYPILELTPHQRRRKTLEALTGQLEALSRTNPVLMIFEDLQWTDPTSLEALDMTVERIKELRALLIVTSRPEADRRWLGRTNVTALVLNRLDERESAAVVEQVACNKPLPASARRKIIERTDGIPLFIEEMTKAALDAGGEDDGERMLAAAAAPSMEVPASLHASLLARLDQLGPAKRVAQIGAVIGREFHHNLLAAVVRAPAPELQSALNRLIQTGLLFRQSIAPEATYLFKHALVQEVAYSTLLREPRRDLHARVAEAVESRFPDIAASRPELLAHHYTEAGLIEKAVGLWGKAGERSLAQSALVEAAEQLKRAISQIVKLPSTPERRRQEIMLQVALTNPLIHIKGYASPETRAAVERAHFLIDQAEELGEPLEDPLLLFSVLYGFWVANYVAFNGDLMHELSAQFLSLAEKRRAAVPVMTGHRIVGTTLLYKGDFANARRHFEQALALYDPVGHRPLAARFGTDAAVSVLFYRSMAQWSLGYPDAALADAKRAVKQAREIGQASTLMAALAVPSITHILCGQYADALALLDEAVALADEKGSLFWRGHVATKGCALVLTGKISEAIRLIISGRTAWQATGTTVWTPTYLAYLAQAYAELGQFEEAFRCVGEATRALQTSKEKWYEPDVHRIAGQVTLMAPEADAAKAEAHLERALSVARRQQAKSWELRAAMSLARLRRDQGKVPQARELLAPVYGWFTEGFDTRDLKDAKALLAELTPHAGRVPDLR